MSSNVRFLRGESILECLSGPPKSNDMGLFRKYTEGIINMQKEVDRGATGARHRLENVNSHQKLQMEGGTRFRLWKKTWLYQHLNFWSLALRTAREAILIAPSCRLLQQPQSKQSTSSGKGWILCWQPFHCLWNTYEFGYFSIKAQLRYLGRMELNCFLLRRQTRFKETRMGAGSKQPGDWNKLSALTQKLPVALPILSFTLRPSQYITGLYVIK